jgi:hypothetical protein
VSAVPSSSMKMNAGWLRMSNSRQTVPSSSTAWANASTPRSSMKSLMASRSSRPATPMKVTSSP